MKRAGEAGKALRAMYMLNFLIHAKSLLDEQTQAIILLESLIFSYAFVWAFCVGGDAQ